MRDAGVFKLCLSESVGIQVLYSAGDNFAVWDGQFPVSQYSKTSLYIIGYLPYLNISSNQKLPKKSSNLPIISIISFNIFDMWLVPADFVASVLEKGILDFFFFEPHFRFFDLLDDLVSVRWGPDPELKSRPIPRPKLLDLWSWLQRSLIEDSWTLTKVV